MKTSFYFLVLCALLAPNLLSARHILGGTMGYYYTQNGQLKVEMVLYRDCGSGGAPFDSPAEIAVYNDATGALLSSFQVYLDSSMAVVVDTQSCAGLFSPCVDRGYYTFSLTLPENDTNYTVVYQRCCRANDITNLLSPADQGLTMQIDITSQARLLRNNSPKWPLDPAFNLCVHQPVDINLSAAEPDGDLLVYSFCSPLLGGGNLLTTPELYSCSGAVPTPPCPPPFNPAPFAVPNYNWTNPLGSAISQLNPTNGVWNITPDFIGKFNYAICVQEYRNGILLSTSLLDLVVFVQDVVGIPETDDLVTLLCTPNPAGDVVFISTEMFAGNTIQIELVDLSGKIWLSEKRENIDSKVQVRVDQLPSGVYLVKILANGKTAAGRIVRL